MALDDNSVVWRDRLTAGASCPGGTGLESDACAVRSACCNWPTEKDRPESGSTSPPTVTSTRRPGRPVSPPQSQRLWCGRRQFQHHGALPGRPHLEAGQQEFAIQPGQLASGVRHRSYRDK